MNSSTDPFGNLGDNLPSSTYRHITEVVREFEFTIDPMKTIGPSRTSFIKIKKAHSVKSPPMFGVEIRELFSTGDLDSHKELGSLLGRFQYNSYSSEDLAVKAAMDFWIHEVETEKQFRD